MTAICDPNPFPAREALPLGSLLILALCSFVTLMTEVMPAGLLPGIGRSLGVPESGAGQLVTAYALGSSITAIPLMAFSQAMRRRRLLLTAIGGFALVNMVTAVSGFYWLTLGARFLAGMFGGIVWALMVGYAVRISPPRLAGRAIAISGGGGPLALSVGVPAGTFLGTLFDWRVPFYLMSLLALVLIPSILAKLPDAPGQARQQPFSIWRIVRLPGLAAIFCTMFVVILAHNSLYTYISSYLSLAGLSADIGLILLIFGFAGMLGLWLVGALVDEHLRLMMFASIVALGVAALALCLEERSNPPVIAAVAIWGLAMGGVPVLFQTAEACLAGDATDIAQAMFVTIWNAGVAGGGILGALLLRASGAVALPYALLLLSGFALLMVWVSRRGFS